MSLPVEKRQQWIKSRREQRKLTKYARLRRQLLRYSILSILLTLGVLALTHTSWYLCQNKQGIDITGNVVAYNSQIRHALKSEIINSPLFLTNPTELENRVQSLNTIQRAFVRRYALPSPTLKVEVLEEFPWGTLYSAASPQSRGFNGITHMPLCASTRSLSGRLGSATAPSATLDSVSTINSAASPSLPSVHTKVGSAIPAANSNLIPQFVIAESGRLISIHDFPNVFQPALKIYCENPTKLNLTASTVEQWSNWIIYISKQMQCPVLAIDMRQPHDVKVETSKFTLVLGNPDSGLTHRLYRLASVLEVLTSQHREPAYVNLSLNSNIPIKLAKKLSKSDTEEKVSRL